MTTREVEEILRLSDAGWPLMKLRNKFKCRWSTIKNIVVNRGHVALTRKIIRSEQQEDPELDPPLEELLITSAAYSLAYYGHTAKFISQQLGISLRQAEKHRRECPSDWGVFEPRNYEKKHEDQR
jgi:hypothetical protein